MFDNKKIISQRKRRLLVVLNVACRLPPDPGFNTVSAAIIIDWSSCGADIARVLVRLSFIGIRSRIMKIENWIDIAPIVKIPIDSLTCYIYLFIYRCVHTHNFTNMCTLPSGRIR